MLGIASGCTAPRTRARTARCPRPSGTRGRGRAGRRGRGRGDRGDFPRARRERSRRPPVRCPAVPAGPTRAGAGPARPAGRGRPRPWPAAAHPLPGEAGFDPWCLSDPAAARSLRRDPDALPALEHLWRSDPDPAATLALFDEVEQAAADGSTARSGQGGGYYDCTPWPTIYTTRQPVTLAGHDLKPGQQFTLDICAGGMMGQAPGFHRDLLLAAFTPSYQTRYCDQDATRANGSC